MWEQAPGRTCGPIEREAHAGAGLGLVTMPEQSVPERLHTVEMTHAGGAAKNCSLLEELRLQKLGKDCLLWEEPHMEQRKCETSFPRGGRRGETACDELTTILIACPPLPLVGEEVEKSGMKLRLGRREG
ncbi:hypothetical protein WISP_111633 [Willisornis vidua]|uniref:Uncharacterized protein n=1 Tax=Willisornis vidua TaxID=1566151 RepID=A0ABQ9CVB0_9PASS|nr:hypothetical protein WISP_111633 [Willisornis vidua]